MRRAALVLIISMAQCALSCASTEKSPNADLRLPAGSRRFRCEQSNSDQEPAYSIRVPPLYPATAARRRETGFVRIEFSLDASGRVVNPNVIEGNPPGVFDSAALTAIRQWIYCPPDNPGEPMETKLNFNLSGL